MITVYVVFEKNWCGMGGTRIHGVYNSEEKAHKVLDELMQFNKDDFHFDVYIDEHELELE